jgi:dTDP-4-amino-4,6-dideoxygalactose transaminase
LTCMTVDFGAGESRRDALRVALEAHAIEARPVWKPLHLQPLFEGRACVGGAVAQQIFESGICLPSGASLTLGDQDRVIVICREQLAAT